MEVKHPVRIIGEMLGEAMRRESDQSAIAMLDYMKEALEESKRLKSEPDWAKIFKESRRIWLDNE